MASPTRHHKHKPPSLEHAFEGPRDLAQPFEYISPTEYTLRKLDSPYDEKLSSPWPWYYLTLSKGL